MLPTLCKPIIHCPITSAGKSLSVLTAEFMYNSDRTIVGSLPDNPEEGFPLSNVWDKKIVVATELSEKFRLPSVSVALPAVS